MESSAATVQAADIGTDTKRAAPARFTALWVVAGLTALGVAIRFPTLGLQSYHHDEVITAARVLPGSFMHMLHEVKHSESNPPFYYVLAWGWAKVFGYGEVGLRSFSALFGAATVPVAYFIGRELSGKRAGYMAAAITAVNPMLIWYSQEARGYSLLVFLSALSFLFFLRALRTGDKRELTLWSLASIGAVTTHYFGVFPVAIEAVWLLVALRATWRPVAVAVGGVAAVGLALIPLIAAQINPHHIGWIDHSPLLGRIGETAASLLIGETGHVIAEPPRNKYAVIPAILILAALALVMYRGSRREKRGAAIGLLVGVGVVALATAAALAGKDYVEERNLLPALIPIAAAGGIGFATARARRVGLVLITILIAYWIAFDVYVTQTPSLQRPDLRKLAQELGQPVRPRAVVTWKLSAAPVEFYVSDGGQPLFQGTVPLREVAVIGKPWAAGRPVPLPPAFHPVERLRFNRLVLTRYLAAQPQPLHYELLHKIPTGFRRNAVVIDGEPAQANLPGRIALLPGPNRAFVTSTELPQTGVSPANAVRSPGGRR
ncbi:MAG TPA: glycosyltransferase family 39 protein [Solirubrobacterales bacterium]|nr:glycosyltransferase family 39 protein [Solirubrobacterales bacterium]